MTGEEISRCVEAVRGYPFEPKRFAGSDGLEEIRGSAVAVTQQQESYGLVNDVVGSEEVAPVPGQSGLKINSPLVVLISSVPQGQEASGVHEYINRGHK